MYLADQSPLTSFRSSGSITVAAQSIRDDLLGDNLCPDHLCLDNLCLDNLSNLSNLAQTCRSASVTLVTAECVERASAVFVAVAVAGRWSLNSEKSRASWLHSAGRFDADGDAL